MLLLLFLSFAFVLVALLLVVSFHDMMRFFFFLSFETTVPPVIEEFKFDSKLQSGMRTRIYCNVAQGDPPVRLKWTKDGTQLTPISDKTSTKRGISNSMSSSSGAATLIPGIRVREIDEFSIALIIENLESRHHNGNYSCIASNSAAVVNQSAQLLVNGKAIFLYISHETS
jgi:hypothetical protein